jgi:hypothetical protein
MGLPLAGGIFTFIKAYPYFSKTFGNQDRPKKQNGREE